MKKKLRLKQKDSKKSVIYQISFVIVFANIIDQQKSRWV